MNKRCSHCGVEFEEKNLTYLILQTNGCIFRFHTHCALNFILDVLADDTTIWNDRFLALEYEDNK